MAFGWKGQESDEAEIASLRLLEDVHNAIMKACNIRQPPAEISTHCATRHCDDWLKK
jgi:hypothetical protein